MKNSFQFFSKKNGFTLVELMLVVAIIGILIAVMSTFNVNSNISQSRVENFANIISDAIRDAQHNTTIGRIPDGMTSVDSRKIVITKTTGENGSIVRTASGNTLKEENKYEFPFIDGDKNYKIQEIHVSSKALTNAYENAKILPETNWFQVNNLTITFLPNGKIETKSNFQNIDNILSYRITLDYKGFKRYIYGDAVLGNVMIKNLQ